MADDPITNPLRRPAAVRLGIVLGLFVAVGIGLAIGWAAHSPGISKSSQAGCEDNTGTGLGTYSNSGVLCGHGTVTLPTNPIHTSIPRAFTTTTTNGGTTPTTGSARQILPPATTSPVSDECTIPITQSADGNPDPATCPSGGVNTIAWNYIVRTYPNILALGADATKQQVLSAMCNATPMVGGEVSLAGQVAATYYGWSFANALHGWYPGNPAVCSG